MQNGIKGSNPINLQNLKIMKKIIINLINFFAKRDVEVYQWKTNLEYKNGVGIDFGIISNINMMIHNQSFTPEISDEFLNWRKGILSK